MFRPPFLIKKHFETMAKNMFQKFTTGQVFTKKAPTFEGFIKTSKSLSEPKNTSQGKNGDTTKGFDRDPKKVVMEGKFKTIGEGQVFLNEDKSKIQYRIPDGMSLSEYKEKYRKEINAFIAE